MEVWHENIIMSHRIKITIKCLHPSCHVSSFRREWETVNAFNISRLKRPGQDMTTERALTAKKLFMSRCSISWKLESFSHMSCQLITIRSRTQNGPTYSTMESRNRRNNIILYHPSPNKLTCNFNFMTLHVRFWHFSRREREKKKRRKLGLSIFRDDFYSVWSIYARGKGERIKNSDAFLLYGPNCLGSRKVKQFGFSSRLNSWIEWGNGNKSLWIPPVWLH